MQRSMPRPWLVVCTFLCIQPGPSLGSPVPSRHKSWWLRLAGILFCPGEAVLKYVSSYDDFRRDEEEDPLKRQLIC